jgi:HlyD family secretion protein/epimerase transport system membrane fusion protein
MTDTTILPPSSDAEAALWPAVRRQVLITCGLCGIGLFTLVAWAAFTPLENGALGQGVVMATGDRRAVQHLEGGIVGKVMVQEGEQVTVGQPLFEINDERSKAAYQAALYAGRSLEATLARLDAELAQRPEIAFPETLLALEKTDPTIASSLAGEQALFKARRTANESRSSILRQQIAQLNAQIEGLTAQVESIDEQLRLIEQEISDAKALLDKGLERRTRYNALLRAKADLEGQKAQTQSAKAAALQQIGESELRIGGDMNAFLDQVAKEQAATRAQLSVQNEQVRAAEDVLARAVIRAPITGRIMNIRFRTSGAVLKPGETAADIIPSELPLVIEARFNTIYLDSVRYGQNAQIKLLAFNAYEIPVVTGHVISVSPDRTIDERSGNSYFTAVVEVPLAEASKLSARGTLASGMPADVVVVLGEQTVLGQIFQPLTDIIWRSFKTG